MTKPATPKNVVLYADDDVDDLELVQDAFARYSNNVDVVTARDGSQALQYLSRLKDQDPKPCLVILDINMPILNGKEVLIKLRQMEEFESTPVVLFTTSSLPQDHNFAKEDDKQVGSGMHLQHFRAHIRRAPTANWQAHPTSL